MAINLNLRHRAAHDPDCVLDLRIGGACSPPCTVPDLSGHNNNAATVNLVAADLVVGPRENHAVEIASAANEYIQITDDALLDMGTGDLTFAAWLYMAASTAEHWFMMKIGGDYYAISFFTAASHRPIAYINDGVNSTNGYVSTASFPLTAWTHLAVVFNRAAGTVTAYYNGKLQAGSLDISSITGSVDPTGDLRIGEYVGSTGWDGKMAGHRIYRRILSAGEIQALYEQGSLYAESGRMRRRKKLRA